MEKKFKIICPTVPNFVKIEGADASFAVWTLSEDELREIGKEWTEELIKKAKYAKLSNQ